MIKQSLTSQQSHHIIKQLLNTYIERQNLLHRTSRPEGITATTLNYVL